MGRRWLVLALLGCAACSMKTDADKLLEREIYPPGGVSDAGDVGQHIDAPELLLDARSGGADRRAVGDVARVGHRLTAGGADRRRRLLRTIRVAIDSSDARALAREDGTRHDHVWGIARGSVTGANRCGASRRMLLVLVLVGASVLARRRRERDNSCCVPRWPQAGQPPRKPGPGSTISWACLKGHQKCRIRKSLSQPYPPLRSVAADS